MSLDQLNKVFPPSSIAVVGASENPFAAGSMYTQHLMNYTYNGKVYPVNPKQATIFGIPAYPSLKEIPGTVDFVISCIPASEILGLLDECAQKQVHVLHMFTGRFGETGDKEAADLEQQVLQKAKDLGIRLIGPNCMGLYYPREGIHFAHELPTEPGSVGMFFQSGGASAEFIRYAAIRGMTFSKVISYGNAIDLNECDYLEYLAKDDETKIIVAYIEGVKDGRRFLQLLREVTKSKPVVLLKAGRGGAGSKSAASHTGSLAGSPQIWDTAVKQGGAINAQSLDEMIDIVLGLSYLPPLMGRKVAVVGGGGGRSVLSADGWDTAGFALNPLTPRIKQEIRERVPELWWEWIGNPVDVSMMPEVAWMTGLTGDMLKIMIDSPEYDLIVSNITIDAPFGKEELKLFIQREITPVMEGVQKGTKPIIVVMNGGQLKIEEFDHWRWRMLAEIHSELIQAKVPVYSTISQAAKTMQHLADYYENRERARQHNG